MFDDLIEEPLEQALALRPDLPHIAFDGIDRTVMADRLSGFQPAVQHPQPRGQTLQLVPTEGAGYLVVTGSSPIRENNRANCISNSPRPSCRHSRRSRDKTYS